MRADSGRRPPLSPVASPQTKITMAKSKKEQPVEETSKADTGNKALWNKFLEAYQVQNPVKYAEKKASGAFDKMPENFTG